MRERQFPILQEGWGGACKGDAARNNKLGGRTNNECGEKVQKIAWKAGYIQLPPYRTIRKGVKRTAMNEF